MSTFERFLAQALAARGRSAWATDPVVASAGTPGRARIEGQDCLLLCTNDYLGLACDPRISHAAHEALRRFGAGARAARSLSGDTEIHHALEHELAEFKGGEAALLFASGFACNVGVISALTEAEDVIVSDALNHASIVDGCRLSRAQVRVYRHGDTESAEAQLQEAAPAGKRMLVTDAVFSMEGDLAPLPSLLEAADRHGAFMMLDEAHATGVFGTLGKGSLEHFGLLSDKVAVLMGTLGKALGSIGGFVVGSRDLIDFLSGSARSFLFTTSLPAPAAAAALESLRILRSEPERVRHLWANASRLHTGLAELGFTVPAAAAPILPVYFEAEATARAFSGELAARGIIVQPVGVPYVPPNTSRLRLIASAAHALSDIDLVLEAFAEIRTLDAL